ncbi:hypothetical protein GCM10027562_02490 [Arthrobacter pigmenti]
MVRSKKSLDRCSEGVSYHPGSLCLGPKPGVRLDELTAGRGFTQPANPGTAKNPVNMDGLTAKVAVTDFFRAASMRGGIQNRVSRPA